MKIDIRSLLEETGSKLDYHNSFPFSSEDCQGPLDIKVTLTNTGSQVWVEGTIKMTLLLSCGSCLCEFPFPLALQLSEKFLSPEQVAVEVSGEASLEEFSIFTYGPDQTLDLSEAVRQTILLNLPMQRLCSPECKGICPSCGANRNEGVCGCSPESMQPTYEFWAPLAALNSPIPGKKKRRNPRA